MAYEIKYRSEDEMKDSGIEWLGKIPKEWIGCKIKHIASLRTGNSISASDKDNKYTRIIDNYYPYIATKDIDVDTKSIEYDNDLFIPKSTKFEVAKRDTSLICIEGGSAGRKIGYLREDICFGNKLCNVEANNKVTNRLLYYILQSDHFAVEFFNKTTGIIPGVSIEEFKTINTVLPNGEDQQKIANFLDIKIAEFDTIISKKELLIEKLEEAKKSLISEVVTGKVKIVDGQLVERKPEEMKDSGVEWLGMIPKNWEMKKLKYLSKISTGNKDTQDAIEEGIYPFYVRSDNIERSNDYSFDGEAILTAGDGVGVGKVFHYVNGKFAFHQRVYKISNFKFVFGKYLFYYMRENFYKEVMKLSAKSTVDSLRYPMFADFIVAYPNKYEQSLIIRYLDKRSNKIQEIITKTQEQITKLKEAKQSLISEAVTGKIDLRDWEIIETGGR